MQDSTKEVILNYLGVDLQRHTHREKLLSGLGAFLSIASVYFVTLLLTDPVTVVTIIPSMGATAVLLFAAPHVPFSQPWNVFGGHIISAIIGVTCAILVPNVILAGSLAVGVSVTAMYYSRCIHPPGGATALAAVIGSTRLHQLGYLYVIEPVLVNTLTILLIAVLFNGLFGWRRYPAYLFKQLHKNDSGAKDHYPAIKHEDFVYALSEIDTFVDISEDDLLEIYTLATQRTGNTASQSSPKNPPDSPEKP